MSADKHDVEPGATTPKKYVEKTTSNTKGSIDGGRRASVTADIIQGEMFDGRYETTQRGLKSRYVARDT